MNRPKLVGLLSAAFGSTAGFLVMTRWNLAGTITGAILMPVIFTVASFGSHETMERVSGWLRRRIKKGSPPEPAMVEEVEDTRTSAPARSSWKARSIQWSVVTLAFLAFAVSLYSLTKDDASAVTILREKVVETVTVTVEQPALSVAKTDDPQVPTATTQASTDTTESTTTTTVVDDDPDSTDSTDTTVTTVDDPTTTTSLP